MQTERGMAREVGNHEYCRCLMEPSAVESLRQTDCSHLGHFKHAAAFNLISSLWKKHAWLALYFNFDNGVLYDRFRFPGVFRRLRAQVHFFRYRLAGQAVALVKVGKYYELFGDDARAVSSATGLRLLSLRGRGTNCVAGFPVRMRDYYIRKMLACGCSLALIEEAGAGEFVAKRYVHEIYQSGAGAGL